MDLFGNLKSFTDDISSGDATRVMRAGFSFGNPILSPIIDLGNRLKQGHVDSRYLDNDGIIKKEMKDMGSEDGGLLIGAPQKLLYGFGDDYVEGREKIVGTNKFKRDKGEVYEHQLGGKIGDQSPKDLLRDFRDRSYVKEQLKGKGLDYSNIEIGGKKVTSLGDINRDQLPSLMDEAVIRKEQEAAARARTNRGLDAEQEFQFEYGTGAPRVTDDDAPAIGSPDRGASRQRSRFQIKKDQELAAAKDKTLAEKGLLYGDDAVQSALKPGGGGIIGLEHNAQRSLQRGLSKDAYHSLQGQRNRLNEDRDFRQREEVNSFNRFTNQRDFAYNKEVDSRNFRQRVLEGNQALDMRKFELEMQRDMSEDARQTGMINNLLGGLFSLGSLL